MPVEPREHLRQTQAALARTLRGLGPVPAGFDSERLALAAASLRRKRLHSAARAWPALSRSLGLQFEPLFAEYASVRPLQISPREDALEFARFLRQRNKLPAAFHRACRSERIRRQLARTATALMRLVRQTAKSAVSRVF
jgi:hypothetical protein